MKAVSIMSSILAPMLHIGIFETLQRYSHGLYENPNRFQIPKKRWKGYEVCANRYIGTYRGVLQTVVESPKQVKSR